jgi:hypothetical protein
LIGVGYEGRTVDDLSTQPVAIGVSRVADVRLNPIPRKPGLSKTALGRALAEAGIAYEHHRELGNPKANRAGFTGSGEDRRRAIDHYVGLLGDLTAGNALDAVADAARRELVAILCFEADQSRCHRDVLLHEATRRRTRVGSDGGGPPSCLPRPAPVPAESPQRPRCLSGRGPVRAGCEPGDQTYGLKGYRNPGLASKVAN